MLKLLEFGCFDEIDNAAVQTNDCIERHTLYESIVGELDILGTHSRNNAIVPWHINAVGKLLDYLVHIYVDKD